MASNSGLVARAFLYFLPHEMFEWASFEKGRREGSKSCLTFEWKGPRHFRPVQTSRYVISIKLTKLFCCVGLVQK